MTLSKSFILLLIFLLAFVPRTPLCQVVIALSWVLIALLSLMSDSMNLIISYIAPTCLMSSHIEPFYISFAAWFSIFLQGGDFPLSVFILHMCPCIENRYVPLLGTSLFSHLTLVSSYSVTLKKFYYFWSFSNIWKSPKNLKNKKTGQENMLSLATVDSCRLQTENYISHPLVGLIVWI